MVCSFNSSLLQASLIVWIYLSIYLSFHPSITTICATLQQTPTLTDKDDSYFDQSVAWKHSYVIIIQRNKPIAGLQEGSFNPTGCVRERVRSRVRDTLTHVTAVACHWLARVSRGRANASGVRLPMWHNYNNFEPMVGEVCDIIKWHSRLLPNITSTSCIHWYWNTHCVSMYNEESGR